MNHNVRRIEMVVMARLLVAPKRMKRERLIQDIWPLLEPTLSTREWQNLLEELLVRLESQGDLVRSPLGLTVQGRSSALAALGLTRAPSGNWALIQKRVLAMVALNIPADDAAMRAQMDRGVPVLQAQVLKQAYGLPVGETPTFRQALDSLLWSRLGVHTDQPFTLGSVRSHLLSEMLGTRLSHREEKLNALLVARSAEARGTDQRQLVVALLQHWIKCGKAVVSSHGVHVASTPVDAGELSMADLARHVLQAARSPAVHRFGEDQAFIGSVWEQLQKQTPFRTWTSDEFKHRLGEANRTGTLSLSRADLVPAMDPADVAASETRYLNATFHLINIPRGG